MLELVSVGERMPELMAVESHQFGSHIVEGSAADADSTKYLDNETEAFAGPCTNVQQIANLPNISDACEDTKCSTAVTFTIRGYVSYMRQQNIRRNWPFSEKSLQRHMEKGHGPLLPPFEPKPLHYDASNLGFPKYEKITQAECLQQDDSSQEVMLHLEIDNGRSTADDTADVMPSIQYVSRLEERKCEVFGRKSANTCPANLDVNLSQEGEGSENKINALCYDTFIDEGSDLKGATQQQFVNIQRKGGPSKSISPRSGSISDTDRDSGKCEMLTTTATSMNLERTGGNSESPCKKNGDPQFEPNVIDQAEEMKERNKYGSSQSKSSKRSFREPPALNGEVQSQKLSLSIITGKMEITLVNDDHRMETNIQEIIEHKLQKQKGKTQKTRSITDIISSNSAVLVHHKTVGDTDRLVDSSPRLSPLKVIRRKNSGCFEQAREKQGFSINGSFEHPKYLSKKRKQHSFETIKIGNVSCYSTCKHKAKTGKVKLTVKEFVRTRKRKLRTTETGLSSTPQTDAQFSRKKRCLTLGDNDDSSPVTSAHGCLEIKTKEEENEEDMQEGDGQKQCDGSLFRSDPTADAASLQAAPCTQQFYVQALDSCNQKSAKFCSVSRPLIPLSDTVDETRSPEVQPPCTANTQCEMSSLENSEIVFETNESLEASDNSENMQCYHKQSANAGEVENQLPNKNIPLPLHSDRDQQHHICRDVSIAVQGTDDVGVGAKTVCLLDLHTQPKIPPLINVNQPFTDFRNEAPTEDLLGWQHSRIYQQRSVNLDQITIEGAMQMEGTSILSKPTQNLETAERDSSLEDHHFQLLNLRRPCGAVIPPCEKMIPPLRSSKPKATVPVPSWKNLVIMASLGLNVGADLASSLDRKDVSTVAGITSPVVPLLGMQLKENSDGISVKSSGMGFYEGVDYLATDLKIGKPPAFEKGTGLAVKDTVKGRMDAMAVSLRPTTVLRKKKLTTSCKSLEQIPKSRFSVSNISVSVGDRVLRTFPRGLPPGRYFVNADGARCLQLKKKIALQTPCNSNGKKIPPNVQGAAACCKIDSEVSAKPIQGIPGLHNVSRSSIVTNNIMTTAQFSSFPLFQASKFPHSHHCDEVASETVPRKRNLTTGLSNSSGQVRFSESSCIDVNDSQNVGKPMLRLMGKDVMPLSRLSNPQEQSWQCKSRIQQHVEPLQSVHTAFNVTSNVLQNKDNVTDCSKMHHLPSRPEVCRQSNSSTNKVQFFVKPAQFFLARQGQQEADTLNSFNNHSQNQRPCLVTSDQQDILATNLMQTLKTRTATTQFLGNCSKQNAQPQSRFLNVRRQELDAYDAASAIEIEDEDQVEPSSSVTSTSYTESSLGHELGWATLLDDMRSAERKPSNTAVHKLHAQVDCLSQINSLSILASQNRLNHSLLKSSGQELRASGQELRATNSEQFSCFMHEQDLLHTHALNTEATANQSCKNLQTTHYTDLKIQQELLSRKKSNSITIKSYTDPLVLSTVPAGVKRVATENALKARVEMMKAGLTTHVAGSPSDQFTAKTHQFSHPGNQSFLHKSLPQPNVDCYDFLSAKTSESRDSCKASRLNDKFRVPVQSLDARNAFTSIKTNKFLPPELLFMPSLSVAESLQNRSRQILMLQKPILENAELNAPNHFLQRYSVPRFSPGSVVAPTNSNQKWPPQSYTHLDSLQMTTDAREQTQSCKSEPRNSDIFQTRPLLDQRFQPLQASIAVLSGNPNAGKKPMKLASADL